MKKLFIIGVTTVILFSCGGGKKPQQGDTATDSTMHQNRDTTMQRDTTGQSQDTTRRDSTQFH